MAGWRADATRDASQALRPGRGTAWVPGSEILAVPRERRASVTSFVHPIWICCCEDCGCRDYVTLDALMSRNLVTFPRRRGPETLRC